jgi:hypothetical protein
MAIPAPHYIYTRARLSRLSQLSLKPLILLLYSFRDSFISLSKDYRNCRVAPRQRRRQLRFLFSLPCEGVAGKRG